MPFDMMGVEWSRKVAFAGIDVTGHQDWIIFINQLNYGVLLR